MSFYDGSGIEVRKQAKFMQLSQNTPSSLTDMGLNSTYGNAVSLVQFSNGKAISFSGGYIFSADNVLVKDIHATAGIVNSFTYGNF